jgi:hypothetical protein
MTIDDQLRDIARRADQLQRVITAEEVVQRASTHSTRLFTTSSRLNDHRAVVSNRPVQSTEEDAIMIDLEIPSQSDEHRTGSKRVVVAALVAAATVIVLAAMVAIRSDEPTSPADQPSPTVPAASAPPTAAPTTVVPTMSDLEVIEAGVAAFYSGDAERAAELFELADRTDDQIRAESAYQAAIGGRVDLACRESAPGSFNCSTPYSNAMTDAIRQGGGRDVWPVEVEDGVITQFGFTEHTSLLIEMGTFLASEGRFDGYEDCISGPFPESCATIQMENLDGWVAWHQTSEPADRVKTVVESWYRGDCEAAVLLSWGDPDCSASSVPAQTVAYESILGAQVSVENCETASAGDHTNVSCEVQYSNAMNSAVDKPPSVTAREFVLMYGVLTAGPDQQPWYEDEYTEDTELRDSFRSFAEGGELAGEYADAGCASARSPECANLIVDNLDAWATWYGTNG